MANSRAMAAPAIGVGRGFLGAYETACGRSRGHRRRVTSTWLAKRGGGDRRCVQALTLKTRRGSRGPGAEVGRDIRVERVAAIRHARRRPHARREHAVRGVRWERAVEALTSAVSRTHGAAAHRGLGRSRISRLAKTILGVEADPGFMSKGVGHG